MQFLTDEEKYASQYLDRKEPASGTGSTYNFTNIYVHNPIIDIRYKCNQYILKTINSCIK